MKSHGSHGRTTVVNPVNFTRIEEADADQPSDFLGVNLIGNLDMQMDTNVLTGNLSVKEGRMIGREDVNTCVISEDLAQLNHLKLGDKLQFNDHNGRENSTVYEAEIVGIYQVKQMMTPLMSGDTYRSEIVKLGGDKNPQELLSQVNLPQEAWNRNVLQLSGGQQQRVAIARALASQAKVLLADEPTGNLDKDTADEIIALLIKTAHELGKCVIVVTHSGKLADAADEVIQIKNGSIERDMEQPAIP